MSYRRVEKSARARLCNCRGDFRNFPKTVSFSRDREEDNDDQIPIIHAETTLPKEFYGEYYISEMVRYPTDSRRLIVSEDEEGLSTGVMFLNREINVDTLDENFELGPYNGLRKHHKDDKIPPASLKPASETFFSLFSKKLQAEPMDGLGSIPSGLVNFFRSFLVDIAGTVCAESSRASPRIEVRKIWKSSTKVVVPRSRFITNPYKRGRQRNRSTSRS